MNHDLHLFVGHSNATGSTAIALQFAIKFTAASRTAKDFASQQVIRTTFRKSQLKTPILTRR